MFSFLSSNHISFVILVQQQLAEILKMSRLNALANAK